MTSLSFHFVDSNCDEMRQKDELDDEQGKAHISCSKDMLCCLIFCTNHMKLGFIWVGFSACGASRFSGWYSFYSIPFSPLAMRHSREKAHQTRWPSLLFCVYSITSFPWEHLDQVPRKLCHWKDEKLQKYKCKIILICWKQFHENSLCTRLGKLSTSEWPSIWFALNFIICL